MKYSILLILIWLLAGCEEGFPEETEVTTLQVLGIRTDPSWLEIDVPLTLEALWAVPGGEDKPTNAVWFICDDMVTDYFGGALNMCSLLTTPKREPISDNIIAHEIDVPGIVAESPEYVDNMTYSVTAFLLLCGGKVAPLPAAGSSVDFKEMQTLCNSDTRALAQKRIFVENIHDYSDYFPAPVNPRFESVTVNGAPLSDEDVSETTIPCAAPDCTADISLSVVLDSEVYEAETDAPFPITIRWYTTSGDITPLTYESAQPEPLTANLFLEGKGRHDIYVVVRGNYVTANFKQIVIELAPK
jgi:hypothetical protein